MSEDIRCISNDNKKKKVKEMDLPFLSSGKC